MRTQKQMYYDAVKKSAELDKLFLDFVNDGMTRAELQTNIDRRPEVWGRFSNWLDKL